MKNYRTIFWTTISGFTLTVGLLITYFIIPINNNLMIGDLSFPLKGLLSIMLIFVTAWIPMIKLRISVETKPLILLTMIGALSVFLGEFIYQMISYMLNGFTSISLILIEIVKHSLKGTVAGLYFAILIAFYFRTKKLGNVIGIGFLIWIVFGMTLRYIT